MLNLETYMCDTTTLLGILLTWNCLKKGITWVLVMSTNLNNFWQHYIINPPIAFILIAVAYKNFFTISTHISQFWKNQTCWLLHYLQIFT